jgi:suppressor for copper-sensitivity B
MEEGWKISWRSPGDAGYPPSLDWTGSENLASATVSWPAPMRFSVLGFETLGYEDEVVLPIAARLSEAGKPTRLRLALNYLVCQEICIPAEARLALGLPEGPAAPATFAHLIDRFAARVPRDGAAQGLAIERVAVSDAGAAPALTVVAHSAFPFTAPDVFAEGPEMFRFGRPEVEIIETGARAVLRVPVSGVVGPPGPLAGARVTLTLVDGGRAMEQDVTVSADAGTTASGAAPARWGVSGLAAPVSLWEFAAILALALVGGLILNLMPCVLPVLSIKLLSIISHGGAERVHVRMSFLASSAGILFSFLVLAAAAVGLKLVGVAVGWGIQFQQPAFLTAMVLIVTLFACNLWGLFEIRLPGRLADAAAGLGGSHRLGGHFLAGVLATLLATPCTAPFLGTAVGFALARGPAEIFAVFTALGLGLAIPYLAVAAAPGLATRLPHPGPWMVTVRRILGFALAGTAAWLLTVLAVQVSAAASYALAALMAGVAGVLWLARRQPRARAAVFAAVAALAVLAFLAPSRFPGEARETRAALPDSVWRSFEPAAIPRLIASGHVVLVDVTADWCLTCQVNKALVLEQGEVARRLADGEVVAIRADWTKPDDTIAAYLAGFGRYGIPFNAVYGPGAPDGIALPELLREADVLEAIGRAAGAEAKSRPASAEG